MRRAHQSRQVADLARRIREGPRALWVSLPPLLPNAKFDRHRRPFERSAALKGDGRYLVRGGHRPEACPTSGSHGSHVFGSSHAKGKAALTSTTLSSDHCRRSSSSSQARVTNWTRRWT